MTLWLTSLTFDAAFGEWTKTLGHMFLTYLDDPCNSHKHLHAAMWSIPVPYWSSLFWQTWNSLVRTLSRFLFQSSSNLKQIQCLSNNKHLGPTCWMTILGRSPHFSGSKHAHFPISSLRQATIMTKYVKLSRTFIILLKCLAMLFVAVGFSLPVPYLPRKLHLEGICLSVISINDSLFQVGCLQKTGELT